MQFLKTFLALGAVTLTAAQNSTVRINSTSIPTPIRPPVPVVPILPTNASRPGYSNGTVVVIVKSYTTWCPGPTVVIVKDKTYTATGPTMLTITNCPCTITKVRKNSILAHVMLRDAHFANSHPCYPHEAGLTQETANNSPRRTSLLQLHQLHQLCSPPLLLLQLCLLRPSLPRLFLLQPSHLQRSPLPLSPLRQFHLLPFHLLPFLSPPLRRAQHLRARRRLTPGRVLSRLSLHMFSRRLLREMLES